MSSTPQNKKVLLISDNASVAKIIEFIQAPDLSMTRCLLNSFGQPEHVIEPNGYHLIILALSVYANEPIVVLTRTSLLKSVGRIPILVISDKPFQSDPATLITHLNLPFSITQLKNQVRDILGLPQPLPCVYE